MEGDGSSSSRRKCGGSSKRGMATSTTQEESSSAVAVAVAVTVTPCGACKFLRRKCIDGCVFAPYFGTDQGAARFAAVHKVFGASNVSKLLSNIPENRRHEAVASISYEAQARISDPVYGCVSNIFSLQQQVASLKAEIAMMQTQVMNNRFTYTSALQSSQLQQPNINATTYSNNSSTSINLMNLSSFNNNLGFDLPMQTTPSAHSLEPIQFSQLSQYAEDKEENKTQHVFNHH
ncbi:hypothetical protein RJT34_26727 [Clitoria ternatea]|uniref:LOB domain-containing protein n=1 Tax=Clitoria ternatea TaxID=43366 RepID=A0AAN9I872_CLITE